MDPTLIELLFSERERIWKCTVIKEALAKAAFPASKKPPGPRFRDGEEVSTATISDTC